MNSKGAGAMSEANKSALVPRLRFPEFREAEEWRLEPLGSLAKRSIAKNTNGEHARVLTNSAEFGVVDQRDYFEKDIANQGSLEGYYIVEKGDYVYNPRISTSAPVGPVSKNNVGVGVMSPLYTVFRFFSSDNDFFAYYFKSAHWHYYMRRASSTGARHDRMSITNDDFMGLPLPVSNPKEQQKIADCLSSLDELIAAETQRLDALKTHKQGLLQQLFPRAGETVPRLRFSEFRKAGEWKEKALGEAATFYNGRAYAKEELLERGKYTVIRVGNFFTSDKWYYSDLELDDSKYCDDGDLLYAWSASFGPRIWRGGKSIYHYHIWKVVENTGVSKEFLFVALDIETERMKARSANGIGMFHITKGTIESWMSVFPALPEQKKIADCLSSLDDLITAQSQKIDALKIHKKSLMQQLFPVLDEVQV